jgi:hypothetical protein
MIQCPDFCQERSAIVRAIDPVKALRFGWLKRLKTQKTEEEKKRTEKRTERGIGRRRKKKAPQLPH